MPVNPKYIPRNPDEVTSLTSSIEVVRTSDNEVFLATKIPDLVCTDPFDEAQTGKIPKNTKVASAILPAAAIPLSLILNHPNIISIVDIIQTTARNGFHDHPGKYPDITVWEDMDAGSLSYLLPDANKAYPQFDDEKGWFGLSGQNYHRFSLPESLCWHVLRSISKALLWLHYGVKETAGIPGDWQKHDDDWMPILIMDLNPSHIWFKKAKGEETYGECKLGGFEWARVTGVPGGRIAMAPARQDAPLWKQYFWAPEIYKNTTSWTRATEIWALGATIYTMMTGIPPPRPYDYDWQISRMNDKGFSQPLREIVGMMLKHHPADRPLGMDVVRIVERDWRTWRSETEEGRRMVDVDDKLALASALGMRMGAGFGSTIV